MTACSICDSWSYLTIPQVSYSFKITQDGVAAVILGIEEEKDLSAWMNALITASVAKNYLSPLAKASKSLPRSAHTPWNEEGAADEGSQSRRHTVGPTSKITKESYIEIDIGTYEKPTDIMVRLFWLHLGLVAQCLVTFYLGDCSSTTAIVIIAICSCQNFTSLTCDHDMSVSNRPFANYA